LSLIDLIEVDPKEVELNEIELIEKLFIRLIASKSIPIRGGFVHLSSDSLVNISAIAHLIVRET